MRTLYLVTNHKGFGKDWDLEEAKKQFKAFNGKLAKPYRVYQFEAESLDDVSIDQFNWDTRNFASFIHSTLVD